MHENDFLDYFSVVPELSVGKPLAADESSEVLQKVQLESIGMVLILVRDMISKIES